MIKSKSLVNKSKKDINDELRREFIKSSTDETFKKVCSRLKLNDDILMKYTSKLEITACELNNSSKCKGLDKCKNDEVMKFRGDKIYAPFFGKVYTFLYNAIPVTVKFDGSVQEFPKFIYDKIMEKIHEVSESNTPKVEIEDRTGQ